MERHKHLRNVCIFGGALLLLIALQYVIQPTKSSIGKPKREAFPKISPDPVVKKLCELKRSVEESRIVAGPDVQPEVSEEVLLRQLRRRLFSLLWLRKGKMADYIEAVTHVGSLEGILELEEFLQECAAIREILGNRTAQILQRLYEETEREGLRCLILAIMAGTRDGGCLPFIVERLKSAESEFIVAAALEALTFGASDAFDVILEAYTNFRQAGGGDTFDGSLSRLQELFEKALGKYGDRAIAILLKISEEIDFHAIEDNIELLFDAVTRRGLAVIHNLSPEGILQLREIAKTHCSAWIRYLAFAHSHTPSEEGYLQALASLLDTSSSRTFRQFVLGLARVSGPDGQADPMVPFFEQLAIELFLERPTFYDEMLFGNRVVNLKSRRLLNMLRDLLLMPSFKLAESSRFDTIRHMTATYALACADLGEWPAAERFFADWFRSSDEETRKALIAGLCHLGERFPVTDRWLIESVLSYVDAEGTDPETLKRALEFLANQPNVQQDMVVTRMINAYTPHANPAVRFQIIEMLPSFGKSGVAGLLTIMQNEREMLPRISALSHLLRSPESFSDPSILTILHSYSRSIIMDALRGGRKADSVYPYVGVGVNLYDRLREFTSAIQHSFALFGDEHDVPLLESLNDYVQIPPGVPLDDSSRSYIQEEILLAGKLAIEAIRLRGEEGFLSE